ncbi:calcium:proton antiporter [Microbacterium arabinogalactanolyticum]|uniref:Calcium:proton antiporter n=1 Tax=Microbacterium arabinogalactanolyticum TaxID=69365 RepID=A0ABQ5NDF2_9MICO|nr:calcium:proton antiporter [Microbacterium arabinogalactanolyticum]GLC83740.1 calcium:proton antiporter [Microbacterium arabinogalactanolyticum]
MRTLLRTVLTPTAVLRLVLGWGSFLLLLALGTALDGDLPAWLLWLLLAGIVAVITVSAFGVVTEAEHLAHRLGDPYGTLVLTISIAAIEVILIAAVMLGPGEHTTIARDSVMAVSMIIMNLVIGVALLVGGMRHRHLRANPTGVSLYLGMLIVLLSVAFALPALIGGEGAYAPAQAIPLVLLTVGLYAFFLLRQMGAQRTDFQEVPDAGDTASPASSPDAVRAPIGAVLVEHRAELTARTLLLIAMVLPIVLLSHDMATLLDDGLDRLGAPVALSGILIAMIVFLPETITTIRAALGGEMQRMSNLCHGALVSTAGLTIPAVLTIGLLTGQHVLLAESPVNLLLLGMTLLLTMATFLGRRLTALHGAAHLFVFVLYGMSVFS